MTELVFQSVEKYMAYLAKTPDGKGSDALSTEMVILAEGLERTAEDDGAGWSTVGIGHSLSHGGEWVFDKAGVSWKDFDTTKRLNEEDAKKLFAHGDYQRFKVIAENHLGKEWFAQQPRNFQDAVVFEVFNKGELGFFHKARATSGYEKDIVDQEKIRKLKDGMNNGDAKMVFEAFTTGQSVSASKADLKNPNGTSTGDTVRERLASRRPWAGTLATAHLRPKGKEGVIDDSMLDAMANDQLLKDVGMDKQDIIARTVKYANTRDELKLDGVAIPDYVATEKTKFEYKGTKEKVRSYDPPGRSGSRKSRYNGRDEEHFLEDISDLPPVMQLLAMLLELFRGRFDEEGSARIADRIGQFTPAERESVMPGTGAAFRNSSDLGTASDFQSPTAGISKFNHALLGNSFQKSAIYPVENAPERVITSDFGPRNIAHGSRIHPAFDLRAKAGDKIVSIFDGRIVHVGQMDIKVQNTNGTITTYFHVDGNAQVGQTVKAGERIATVLPKCSRSPYDPHLDIRTQDASSGVYIHPSKYMELDGVSYKEGAKCKEGEFLLIDKQSGKLYRTEDVPASNNQGASVIDAAAQKAAASLAAAGVKEKTQTKELEAFTGHNMILSVVETKTKPTPPSTADIAKKLEAQIV